MSSSYTSQPATKGKVIIKTSAGDLEVELWPRECPKASRNFVQLCLEGYYDDTPIHRIIPKFIVQMGDPTGTGLGGESIYTDEKTGLPRLFEDEFHSRLRFTQRGLLATANMSAGKANSNGSQFFFTLDATPGLNGKHTIFGKIVGNTIYNLIKLGELETDKDDKPLFNAKILTCEVLANPFDDIEVRSTREEREEAKREAEEMRKMEADALRKKSGKKNLALLSFGGDAATTEAEASRIPNTKIMSSHDLLGGKEAGGGVGLEGGDKLPSAAEISNVKKRKKDDEEEEDEDVKYDKKMREKVVKKNEASKAPVKLSSKELLEEQIKKLQGEIKQIGAPKKKEVVEVKYEKGSVAKMRREFLSSGKGVPAMRKDVSGGDASMGKLKGFEDALKEAVASSKAAGGNDGTSSKSKVVPKKEEEVWECSLHFIKNCSSCRDTFGEEISEDDEDWMNATLKFEKAVGANVFAPKVDDYFVIDPLALGNDGGAKKADPFGRDIQVKGDIKGRQTRNWSEKSTMKVKNVVDQASGNPDFNTYNNQ